MVGAGRYLKPGNEYLCGRNQLSMPPYACQHVYSGYYSDFSGIDATTLQTHNVTTNSSNTFTYQVHHPRTSPARCSPLIF